MTPKLIDFETKGNIIRLWLGRRGLEDWGGDDWDDMPYEHNAGTVYCEYAIGWMDVALPWEVDVFEPATGHANSRWRKDDMRAGSVAMVALFRPSDYYLEPFAFEDVATSKSAVLLYMGDTLDEAIGKVCALGPLGLKVTVARYDDGSWEPEKTWSHWLDVRNPTELARKDLCMWVDHRLDDVPIREREAMAMGQAAHE